MSCVDLVDTARMNTHRNPTNIGGTVDFAALRLALGPGLQALGSTEQVLRQVTVSCARTRG